MMKTWILTCLVGSPALILFLLHAFGKLRKKTLGCLLLVYVVVVWGTSFVGMAHSIDARARRAGPLIDQTMRQYEEAKSRGDSIREQELLAVAAEQRLAGYGHDQGAGIVLMIGWIVPLVYASVIGIPFLIIARLRRWRSGTTQ